MRNERHAKIEAKSTIHGIRKQFDEWQGLVRDTMADNARLRDLLIDAIEMESKTMSPQCPFCRRSFVTRSEHPANCPALNPDGTVK